MKPVVFIQFLLPHGEQRENPIDLDDRYADIADQIHQCGGRLTAEILTSGLCSFCVEHRTWGDFDAVIVTNGPGVPMAIMQMLDRFSSSQFLKWVGHQAADDKEPDVET